MSADLLFAVVPPARDLNVHCRRRHQIRRALRKLRKLLNTQLSPLS